MLTKERIEEIRHLATVQKVDGMLVQEQEVVALCDAALALRSERKPTGDALSLAMRFHEIYERRAPYFGYETREETRHFDPAGTNGQLMLAVCEELLGVPTPKEAEMVVVPRVTLEEINRDAWSDDKPRMRLIARTTDRLLRSPERKS